MANLMGVGIILWTIALVVVGFCLFISPLMIWKHTNATSQKLDEVIRLLKKSS